MWKLFYTFFCGIIVVSSLNVSSQKNGQALPKKAQPIDWDTLFPLASMDTYEYQGFVLNITALLFEVQGHVVHSAHELLEDSTTAVETYIKTTDDVVRASENEMHGHVYAILDPIKVLRPSTNQCWRVYNNFTDVGDKLTAAAVDCSLKYLDSLYHNLTAIAQALKEKHTEISKPSEPFRPCVADEGCQKNAKEAIKLAKQAVEEFLVGWNTIKARTLSPDDEVNKCAYPTVNAYLRERAAVIENVRSCVDMVPSLRVKQARKAG